ncbi:MAG: hypothetical protein AUK47_27995 [Deltaproteobacteria bacterium CG2_30_63_29]|nr:MAG: hypothetical protein AUK47_27995 [Deltaproteobacteria bacterium CG2_30_63_29]PJB36692.1 MAG: hypothetical protein CO108_22735 [Deltaproteobacteria bacterium CG_4_9_14_3_um_filter_63_12]
MALDDILKAFSEELTAFAATGVVHHVEGTSIASRSEAGVDADTGNAYLAEMLKQYRITQAGLGFDDEALSLVLESSAGTALASPLGDSEYLWTVLVGPAANVALTQAVMRKYYDRVLEALPV